MRFFLNPYIAIPLALLAIMSAGVLWYTLVRPVPDKTGFGVIVGRSFAEGARVEKTGLHTGRAVASGTRTTAYTLSDRHVYDIELEEDGSRTRFSIPAAAAPLEVGQRVRLVYIERKIPFAGKRIYIHSAEATDE